MLPNRVRAVIADRPYHTTEHAGPHSAVQAGWEASGPLAQGWDDDPPPQSRCPYEPGVVEAVSPPPCPPWSVLRAVLRGQATLTAAACCSGVSEDYAHCSKDRKLTQLGDLTRENNSAIALDQGGVRWKQSLPVRY
jgi:hypothetical protein